MSSQYLTINPDYTYGASIDGTHYSQYFRDNELDIIAQTFARFQNHSHGQIAVDAGGVITEQKVLKFGDVEILSVQVDKSALIAFCNQLDSNKSSNGMKLTSTGNWVTPDDWDVVESRG